MKTPKVIPDNWSHSVQFFPWDEETHSSGECIAELHIEKTDLSEFIANLENVLRMLQHFQAINKDLQRKDVLVKV